MQVCLQKRTFQDCIEQENREPDDTALAQPLSKRSRRLLDPRESAEVQKSTRVVQFDDVLAGSKSNSMSFAELRNRHEQQSRLARQDSLIGDSEEGNLKGLFSRENGLFF